MPTWISLLRAVNLGSHNKVSMPALREHLAEAGFEDVRTYVQSGNLVTSSRHRTEHGVARAIAKVVADRHGVDVPVVVRSPDDMARVLALDPFPAATKRQPKLVSVVFFEKQLVGGKAFAAHAASLGEEVVVDGRELYISYTARGVHASKLTPALLRRRLGQDGTARNWRTVGALVDLTR
jgi:uncharacterized protein (DUF1697 family)